MILCPRRGVHYGFNNVFVFQRRDYRVLAEHLPPKQEYVLNIRLSPVQDQLYRRYLEKTRGVFLSSDLFSTYHSLSKVTVDKYSYFKGIVYHYLYIHTYLEAALLPILSISH